MMPSHALSTARPPAPWPSSRGTYWLLQVGGWSGVAAVHIGAVVLGDRASASMVTGYVVASLVALLGTHALRVLLHRRGWLALPMLRLGAILLIACVVIASLVVGSAVALERTAFPDGGDGAHLQGPTLLAITGYWVVLVAAWSECYLVLHFFRTARLAERDRWHLEAMARQGELNLLRSQLDPHFLFNSLNGIRALVVEDPERAREVLTRLADTLRYALRSSGEPTVPLEQELETVRSYLALESVRLEERLRVRLHVDDGLRDAHVPPMIVQMLVENGIKHGVATLPGGGTIDLRATRRDGALVVRVESSGRLDRAAAGQGVGLRNARERLRLLYGARAGLSLEQQDEGTVAAELRLPLAEEPRT